MEDIAGSFRERGDEYDDSLPDNIESLKNVARWILEDADREHIYIDLDTIEGRELAEPLFSPFRSLLSDSAETGTDPGYRSNPIYGRIRELNEKITIVLVSHDMTVISSYATAVACINGTVYYHGSKEITSEMLQVAYGSCPVELVAHGIPHRVLAKHDGDRDA